MSITALLQSLDDLREAVLTPRREAKEAFLTLLADSAEWAEDPDGDMNEAGGMVDLTTFKLVVSTQALEEFCQAIGIEWSIADKMTGIGLKRVIDRELEK